MLDHSMRADYAGGLTGAWRPDVGLQGLLSSRKEILKRLCDV